MIGEPALAVGNTIVVGDHQLEVERACSGLRIFVGIAALAYAYVVLVRRCWWEKCLLLIAVVPIALISNAARIVVDGVHLPACLGGCRQEIHPRCGGLGHDRAGRRAVWTVALVLEVADPRLHRSSALAI